jgi:signal transduction histidine kinase
VADIWDYLAPPAGFVLACPDPMPTLLTPRAPLEQVLRNLIGNAIKHHDRAHARIEVSARACGDCIEFRISDDGPGVPPEFHERIFQMFQTLKPRDQMEGSGMGLAIVRKAVEAAGGSVRVQSAHPERGTTFLFTWPAGTHAGD